MTYPAPDNVPYDEWFDDGLVYEDMYYLPNQADELGGDLEIDPSTRINSDMTYKHDFLDNLANHKYEVTSPKKKESSLHEQLYNIATRNGGSWMQGGSENIQTDQSGRNWNSGAGK